MAEKTCTRCKQTYVSSEFGIQRNRLDGLNPWCRYCVRKHARAYYAANREKARAYQVVYRATHADEIRANKIRHAERQRAYNALYEEMNPDEFRVMKLAHRAVRDAVRKGILVRPPRCQECGNLASVHGAHHDYEKPLDVRWLCAKCHVRWDKAQPKMMRDANGVQKQTPLQRLHADNERLRKHLAEIEAMAARHEETAAIRAIIERARRALRGEVA